MNRQPSLAVTTPRILDLSTYVGLVVMGGLGVAGLTDWPRRLAAIGLCLAFGGLYAWAVDRPRSAWFTAVVLGTQTVVVATAMLLHSTGYEAFAFLLVLLAVHAATVLPPSIAAVWVFGFWVIHSAVALTFDGPRAWFVVAFNLTIYLLCGVFGNVLRRLAVAKDELGQTLRRLRRAQDRIRSLAVAEERGRLARELHDSVKQNLFAAGMHVGTARALLASDPRRAETSLRECDELILKAGSDLALVIHELKPVELEEIGLTAVLRDYIQGWSRRSGIEASFEADDGAPPTPTVVPEFEYALLRVAQEALANISRHSRAGSVTVRLSRRDTVTLTVRDDGTGFDPEPARAGFGLRSMRERVELLGGEFTIASAPGRGTEVTARAKER